MATLAITTLERVRAVASSATTVNDARITELIGVVSDYAEKFLARHLKYQRYTDEDYRVRRGEPLVWLQGMPIGTVHSIKYANRRNFTDIDALDTDDFDVHDVEGQIELRCSLTGDPGWARFDYEGGMAVDTTEFIANYTSIAEAATLEVINRLARSGTPEGDVKGFESGVTHKTPQLNTLDAFNDALGVHRRIVL